MPNKYTGLKQNQVPCPCKSLITNGRYFDFFVTGFFGVGKKGKNPAARGADSRYYICGIY
jgi:hypothetical protein